MGADTLILPDESVETETSEPDVAHWARRGDIAMSSLTGEPIEALCGVLFVPMRDPSRYPVCPACKRVMSHIASGRGGLN